MKRELGLIQCKLVWSLSTYQRGKRMRENKVREEQGDKTNGKKPSNKLIALKVIKRNY